MPATAGSTTIELPRALRDRLRSLKTHPRQPYHEVIAAALGSTSPPGTGKAKPGLDALVLRHRAALLKAAKENNIRKLWLFGSRARGDARPDSDVDLMYQAMPGATLWDVSGFLSDAQEILGRRVDLADRDNLSARLVKYVLPDAVPL